MKPTQTQFDFNRLKLNYPVWVTMKRKLKRDLKFQSLDSNKCILAKKGTEVSIYECVTGEVTTVYVAYFTYKSEFYHSSFKKKGFLVTKLRNPIPHTLKIQWSLDTGKKQVLPTELHTESVISNYVY